MQYQIAFFDGYIGYIREEETKPLIIDVKSPHPGVEL